MKTGLQELSSPETPGLEVVSSGESDTGWTLNCITVPMSTEEAGISLFSAARAQKRKAKQASSTKATAAKAARTTGSCSPNSAQDQRIDANKHASTSDSTTFHALGLGDHLHGVCAALSMTTPTPVQVRLSKEIEVWQHAVSRYDWINAVRPHAWVKAQPQNGSFVC